MNNQEILEKAIQKAIDGGFPQAGDLLPFELVKNRVGTYLIHSERDGWASVEGLIFNHDFAKAIWGEQKIDKVVKDEAGIKTYYGPHSGWQYHLQQMVIADDPIKYLGDNI